MNHKRKITVVLLSVILSFVLIKTPLFAEENSFSDGVMNLSSMTAGDLASSVESILNGNDFSIIKTLVVSGEIDTSDLSFIVDNLDVEHLDLSDSELMDTTIFPDYSFMRRESIKTCGLPKNITEIGAFAFLLCTNLEDVVLPDSLLSIGLSAFYYCENLKNIEVGSNLRNIGSAAFMECISLEKIDLPEGLEEIGNNVFSGCENLLDIVLPDSLILLGASVFEDCISLKRITIPSKIITLEPYLFVGCEDITVTLQHNDGVVELSGGVFSGCQNIIVCVPEGMLDQYLENIWWSQLIDKYDGAIYEDREYHITVNANAKGKVSADVIKAYAGTTIKLSQSANQWYNFKGWKSSHPDKLKIENNSFIMPYADIEIDAIFEAQPVSILASSKTVYVGGKVELTPTITGGQWTYDAQYFTFANVSEKGSFTAKKAGVKTIKYAAPNGAVASVNITILKHTDTVNQVRVTNVQTIKTLYIVKGKSVTLPLVISPDNASNKSVTWKSSRPKVVTVTKKGEVKGVKKGKSIITARANDGSNKKITCTVYVVNKALPLKNIKVKPSKPKKLKVGKTLQIKLELKPKTATGIVPTYKSSKPKIVSVDKLGKLKALKKGKATITVKAGGKKKKIVVMVK